MLSAFSALKRGNVNADISLVLLPICAAVCEEAHTAVHYDRGGVSTCGIDRSNSRRTIIFGYRLPASVLMYYCPNTFFRNARTSPCAFFMAASL